MDIIATTIIDGFKGRPIKEITTGIVKSKVVNGLLMPSVTIISPNKTIISPQIYKSAANTTNNICIIRSGFVDLREIIDYISQIN